MLRRAHYAGLVKQIDHEVGCIVEALRRKGVLDNTIIIFSSDHGDYLGDHGLSGKASFYEGACHVPLLVRHPALQNSAVSQDLVTLTDVTATLLNLAGQSVPGYMDSIPLPGLDLPDNTPRQYIAGFLNNSWMLFDGQWKLCKYVDGQHLFNLEEDPTEQHNRACDPSCADIMQRLDTQLTAEIMRSVGEAFFPQSVYTFSHSSNPDFGRVGWHRDYPMPWNQIHPD
jgi:arylsulfatase A-like enzyme